MMGGILRRLLTCVLLLLTLCACASAERRVAFNAGFGVGLKSHFHAVGDGVADDTTAVHAFLAACAHAKCFVERGIYRVTSAPPKMNYAIALEGDGLDVSEFIRDYDEPEDRGFLHFEGVPAGQGPTLSHFSVASAPGRTGGHALAALSTATQSFGNMRVEQVKLSTYGKDSWTETILIDGRAKNSGAKGARAIHFDGCLVFGAAGYSMALFGVSDFRYDGGVYAAGGTNPYSGGILVAGTREVPSSGILLIGNAFGYLNLTHVTGMKVIAASGIAGQVIEGVQRAIDSDATADRVQIIGEPYGTVTNKWTNSSVIWPDGRITH